MEGEKRAVAVVGSANLTGDGLFRNIELATAVYLDFEKNSDFMVYKQYDLLIRELLDARHPNVQRVDKNTIKMLADNGVIKSESRTNEPGVSIRSKKRSSKPADVSELFPPIQVPLLRVENSYVLKLFLNLQ
jgi:hypothetical protein